MISDTLDSIGLEYDVRGDEAVALCPGHLERTGRADSHPSWSINLATGIHYCFSCGYRGTLERLVSDMLGIDFAAAKQFVQAQGVDPQAVTRKVRAKRITRIARATEPFDISEYLSFDEVSEEMAATRGLTTQTCVRFGIRARGDAWILPIGDGESIWGWQEKSPKGVLNHPTGVQKGRTLFGYREDLGEALVVVESPLDAALCSQYGHDAVATFGASVSDAQIRLLSRHYPVLAFDNDVAGQRAESSVGDRLRALGVPYRVIEYPEGIKDFGDLDDPENELPKIVESSVWSWKRSLRGTT